MAPFFFCGPLMGGVTMMDIIPFVTCYPRFVTGHCSVIQSVSISWLLDIGVALGVLQRVAVKHAGTVCCGVSAHARTQFVLEAISHFRSSSKYLPQRYNFNTDGAADLTNVSPRLYIFLFIFDYIIIITWLHHLVNV